METALAPLADRYVVAPNPGPYNRGWAFNIGAMLTRGVTEALCVIDADLLVSPDLLRRGLNALSADCGQCNPIASCLFGCRYDGPRDRDRLNAPLKVFDTASYYGQVFNTSQGGCLFVAADFYWRSVGTTNGFGDGATKTGNSGIVWPATPIEQLPLWLLDPDHPRPDMIGVRARRISGSVSI